MRVLLLRDVYGYSVSETASILKTTEGAVKAALHRAHKELQSLDPVEEELVSISTLFTRVQATEHIILPT